MVRIITDSTSSIPQDIRAELGIEVTSLIINRNGEELVESETDLDAFYKDIYEMADNIPTSSQPPLGKVREVVESIAKTGASLDDCIQAANTSLHSTRFVFAPESLLFLQKGGRIGKAAALIGNMISLTPVLTVNDGEASTFSKCRTQKKALAKCSRCSAKIRRRAALRISSSITLTAKRRLCNGPKRKWHRLSGSCPALCRRALSLACTSAQPWA